MKTMHYQCPLLYHTNWIVCATAVLTLCQIKLVCDPELMPGNVIKIASVRHYIKGNQLWNKKNTGHQLIGYTYGVGGGGINVPL